MAREDDPKIRAVAQVPEQPQQQRGVARVPEISEATSRIYASGKEDAPVFVDDSGKRGRMLTWVSLAVAVLLLGLVAALWLSQAASTGG